MPAVVGMQYRLENLEGLGPADRKRQVPGCFNVAPSGRSRVVFESVAGTIGKIRIGGGGRAQAGGI
jgi:hypothetical protein